MKIPAAFLLALGLIGCAPDLQPVAESTKGMQGRILSGAAPAEGARVSAFPEAFNPYVDTLADSLRTVTGADGRFALTGLPEGRYNVLAEAASGGGAALAFGVEVRNGVTSVPPQTLKPRGAARVPRGEGVAQGAGYLYVPGSPWFLDMTDVEHLEESVVLSDLAPATYSQLRFIGGDADLDLNALYQPLGVAPGDTSVVNLYLSWPRSRLLTLFTTPQGAGVAGDVEGCPLLIRLDKARFDFSQARGEGQDLRFTDTAGLPLPFQIERWDSAGGSAEIWVRAGRIEGNRGGQALRMYWGNRSADPLSDGTRVFPGEDGFAGVWHLSEADTGAHLSPLYRNSVADADHGLDSVGSMGRGGAVGWGTQFSGRDYIRVPYAGLRLKPKRRLTVTAWFRPSAAGAATAEVAAVAGAYHLGLDSGAVRFSLLLDSAARESRSAPLVTDMENHFLAGTFDGEWVRTWLDGQLVDSARHAGEINYASAREFFIGRSATGFIDEVQVSVVARPADWIKLAYETQRPGSKLIVHGP